ncbi:MAG: DUF4401 domain-containing protein [Alphaproteobacteria bacterium]
MSRFLTCLNAQTVVDRLHKKGLVDEKGAQEIGATVQKLSAERELPVYLRILSGIGAVIATGCLMGFLGITGVISLKSSIECVLWGTLFIANAIVLLKRAEKSGVTANSFLMQLSFCSMGVGKTLFVLAAGTADIWRHFEIWPLALTLAAVTAVTWPFYRLSIDRFASSFGVLMLLFAALFDDRSFNVSVSSLLMNALVMAEIAAAAVIFTSGRVARDWRPLGYALLSSLAVKVSMISFGIFEHSYSSGIGLSAGVVSIMLAITLVGLIGWAADGLDKLREGPLSLACLGALLLAALGQPGLLFSIILMVLGYARHDRLLLIAGALVMPVFIWAFYYHMKVTLLVKAGIMVLSGIVLLSGWAYMAARNLNKELEIC